MSHVPPQESRLDRFFRRASAHVPECLRKREHGDRPDGHHPYALISVQLFKNDVRHPGHSEDDNGFDHDVYERTVEGVEHVVRINRHTFSSSLLDLADPIFWAAFFALGWWIGFTCAFALIDLHRAYG